MPTNQKKADERSLKRKKDNDIASSTHRGTIDVVLDHGMEVPFCEHGPCLLFEQYSTQVGETPERYFACSVYRSKHKCGFKWPAGKAVDPEKVVVKKTILKAKRGRFNRQQLKERSKTMAELTAENRSYCTNCQLLLLPEDRAQHQSHKVVDMVSDHLLRRPTRLITALEAKEQEAQYWFSKDALKFLGSIPQLVEADAVLCIGTPRLYEHLIAMPKTSTKCFMLDYDFRFAQFFNVLQFGQYNMFTHYFYSELEKKAYNSFLSKASKLMIFIDPPFGGLVEPISQSLGRIKQDWLAARAALVKQEDEVMEIVDTSLHIGWIFPYYLEKRLKETIVNLEMSDFKVNYENHPLYQPKTGKSQSPIRLFTDIPLKLLKLPEEHGYKHCSKCDKYVAQGNKHCKLCDSCTSKDGRNYRHCSKCERCVKATYSHCRRCKCCHLAGSACIVAKGCSLCGDLLHRRNDCSSKLTVHPESEQTEESPTKKQKV